MNQLGGEEDTSIWGLNVFGEQVCGLSLSLLFIYVLLLLLLLSLLLLLFCEK